MDLMQASSVMHYLSLLVSNQPYDAGSGVLFTWQIKRIIDYYDSSLEDIIYLE